jgi:hypothetical protein
MTGAGAGSFAVDCAMHNDPPNDRINPAAKRWRPKLSKVAFIASATLAIERELNNNMLEERVAEESFFDAFPAAQDVVKSVSSKTTIGVIVKR